MRGGERGGEAPLAVGDLRQRVGRAGQRFAQVRRRGPGPEPGGRDGKRQRQPTADSDDVRDGIYGRAPG